MEAKIDPSFKIKETNATKENAMVPIAEQIHEEEHNTIEEAQNKRGTNVLRTLSSDRCQLAELRAKLAKKPSKFAGLAGLVE